MGLYREILYSNAPVLKFHDNFYGNEYEEFQKLNIPTPKEIRDEQLRKLSIFQTEAFKNNSKTAAINNFLFLNGKIASSNVDYDQIIYSKMQDIFQQINLMISSGYIGKKVRNEMLENKELEQQIIFKLKKLASTLEQLRSQSGMIISSMYIDQLNNILLDLSSNNIDTVLRTLYHLKGDILEEIGTEWFNSRIPQNLKVKAISTGAILNSKNQGLMQDIIVIDMENIDLLKTPITFSVNGKDQTKTLQDFFSFIESKNTTENISITNEAERLLKDISLIGVQAKSGINQLPWNTGSKNTWVSIYGGGQLSDYCKFLQKIEQLRNTTNGNWQGDKNIKAQSTAYTAMANYELASSLSKVLHLSQQANQYVLTPNGFMPFVSRILELYEQKGGGEGNYYFSFGGKISLTNENDVILKTRPVVMKI